MKQLTANPLVRHELRTWRRLGRLGGSKHGMSRIVLGAAALLYVTLLVQEHRLLAGGWRDDSFAAFIIATVLLALLIACPLSAAAAIAEDRRRGTWEPLLLTPLSGSEIVWGKLGAKLLLPATVMLAAAPFLAIATAHASHPWSMLLAYVVCVPPPVLGVTALGLLISARARNPLQARAQITVLLFTLMIGLPMAEQFVYDLFLRSGSRDPVLGAVVCPFISFAGLSELVEGRFSAWSGAAMLGPVFYLAMFAVCMTWLSRRFDRWCRDVPTRRKERRS
jgi:ABC-type Na+ efflux pump permease subunit